MTPDEREEACQDLARAADALLRRPWAAVLVVAIDDEGEAQAEYNAYRNPDRDRKKERIQLLLTGLMLDIQDHEPGYIRGVKPSLEALDASLARLRAVFETSWKEMA